MKEIRMQCGDESRVGVNQLTEGNENNPWLQAQLVQCQFPNDQAISSELMRDEIDNRTAQNITRTSCPREITQPRNQKQAFNRNLQSRIIKKYTKLTRTNPQITQFLSSITKDIKNNLLITSKPSSITNVPLSIQTISPSLQPTESAIITIPSQIVADNAVMKQSCFRSLLVQNHGDNDVPSDEQDLNAGIRYMYGELLYSVGNELVNQRKPTQVRGKEKDGNKENQDMNNRQHLSNSKAHIGKTANNHPKTNTKTNLNQTSQIKSRSNAQPFQNIKPQILRL